MSAYREPADADDVPHCLGLAYAGTRALDPTERVQLRTRTTARTWQITRQVLAIAVAGPGVLAAALMVAARGSVGSVVVFGSIFVVGTVAASMAAGDRVLGLLQLRRDQARGEVLRFEGVLPADVLEDANARRLASMALIKESVATSVELLPHSGFVWRMHDVLVEVPLHMRASRNIPARRT